METKYVAGLLFNDARTSVALIHKQKGPAVLINKWNAIGGKRQIQEGLPLESSSAAMFREFIEEAGVAITTWTPFLILRGTGWQVDFFHAFSTEHLSKVTTCEKERVSVFSLSNLPEIVPNLNWIIPMALSHENEHVWVYEVLEKEIFQPRTSSTKERK